MTIDEAIEFERYLSKQPEICNKDFMKCEEHKQLAEWLEELKEARKGFEENRKAGYSHGYADGYAKAIDEFAEALKESQKAYEWCCTDSPMELCDGNCEICWIKFGKEIDEIAEQLKGVRND